MKHSLFNVQKNGMPQRSALYTYGELEEIIDEDTNHELFRCSRESESSESEDDQISQEMAKYNTKLKEDSLKSIHSSPHYGRPPYAHHSSVHHRFCPVRSITPEEENKLSEVDKVKDQIAAHNCVNFQQLFKGNTVPLGDLGYGRPPIAFLQKPAQIKAATKPISIFENAGSSSPAKETNNYGAPLNCNTYSEHLLFHIKKHMQDQLERATRNVDKTKQSTESLTLLDFNIQVDSSKEAETTCDESTFYDSIHAQNGKLADQQNQNVVEVKAVVEDKPKILENMDPSADSKLLCELEPVFKASVVHGNTQKEEPFPTLSADAFSSRSKVLDTFMAKAKPVGGMEKKNWEVNEDFPENINWNGITEVDWNAVKTDEPKPEGSTPGISSPKKKTPEIKWDLEEEPKKNANPAEPQEFDKQPQKVHLFFDLNLDATSSYSSERNQSQQQLNSTQPRSYSSLTHMPMPSLFEQSATCSKELKASNIEPFIDLSKELKKCQIIEFQSSDRPFLTPFHDIANPTEEVEQHCVQQPNKKVSTKENGNEKKQKIIYLAAAISMATMASSEGVLRLSKLVKIIDSVFGGHAKPELYGHEDWCSFIKQHCRKNIQVIPKNHHEALLICNNSDDEN